MAGDVNLFLNDPDDDKTIAEIEVMIAEPNCRRKGLGKEAIILMMLYGHKVLGIRRFYCKINVDNAASLSMFER
jgi:RimJ/RimL family protein N-acetyltransferase